MVLHTQPGGFRRNLLLTDGRFLVQGPQEVQMSEGVETAEVFL